MKTYLENLTPLQISLMIVSGLAVLGVVIAAMRTLLTYYGFGDISKEAKDVTRALAGTAFRDASDLVISGKSAGTPVVVRFSNKESTPGLNIRVAAPATFRLSIVHNSNPVPDAPQNEVKTGNFRFDSRFNTYTSGVTEAKMFLHPNVVSLLTQVACSNNTFVTIGNGTVEVSELLIPKPNTGLHVLEHVKAMVELARELKTMPGSDRVKLVSIAPEKQVAGRVAIAVGAVIAVSSIYAATKVPSQPAFQEVNATLQNGIPPADALLVRDAQQWRVATTDDFDSIPAAWLRNQGRTPVGRILGDFSGRGERNDVGYLLIGPAGRKKIVMLANHANALDGEMVNVALIARIPHNTISKIQWEGGMPPDKPQGDGLLVVQKQGEKQTSVVFFLSP
jgi:hypothetical protein